MKRWASVVCAAALAGCAGPRVSMTEVSPRGVAFLVQNARLVPMKDVDEQGASYCQQHGLSYRREEVVWTGPATKRVAYECIRTQPPMRKQAARTSARPAGSGIARPASKKPKVAAWAKVKAATDVWALCLRFDAEREAKETTDVPHAIAKMVVDACSGLEHAVHEQLERVGEASDQFEADLHAQAVQNAADTVTNVRINAGVPVSGRLASRSDEAGE